MNTKEITYEKASAVYKQNASEWITSRPDDNHPALLKQKRLLDLLK